MSEGSAAVAQLRVGADIGGTFTDLVAEDADGRTFTRKVSSTTDDLARGIVAGLTELLGEQGIAPAAVREVVHGTTVATNAILEGTGPVTGLITTRGFRDVLEIRRLRMPRLYDVRWEKPPPLVRRRLRLEVEERIGADGTVVRPLVEDHVRRAVETFRAEGVQSIAVCLINSYVNPVHERRVGELLEALCPDLYRSLSWEVLPEIREYERTSTTVVNAYLLPVVERYLGSLLRGLEGMGVRAPLAVMQSNGGIMSARAAMRWPMHIVESGPAAGVIGAARLAREIGVPNVITLDMGGTTAKASLVERGELTRTAEFELGGTITIGSRLNRGGAYHLRTPTIDIAEVGAGGGSIVWIDRAGTLQVGPRSAGAVPGPVCYDAGGQEPTLTDANLALGYLNPAYLVGGALRLNAERAREALWRKVAQPLGMTLDQAAYGVHLVGTARMGRAVRAVSSERGRDPRDFELVAFGGNGGVHGPEMARSLDIPRVIVPPAPGLFSAFGLLDADVEHHLVRTFLRALGHVEPESINQALEAMEAEALEAMASQGYDRDQVELEPSADMHYAMQSFELPIPLPQRRLAPGALAELGERFEREHERTYGHRGAAGRVELVNLRLIARVRSGRSRTNGRADEGDGGGHPAQRRAYFGPQVGWREVPVLRRADLRAGPLAGPLIVEEYDATTLVPDGCRAHLDRLGNIIIELVKG